jgi:2-polyprenyl-3-methyl-5-hydroxy-6-metoxy-1,4-benzoquinol methylase
MKMHYPLCHSENAVTTRTVPTSDVKKIYSVSGIEVAAEFEGHSIIDLKVCQDCDCQFFFPELPGSPAFYEQLQQHHWYYPSEKSEFDFARKYIDSTNSVLEIGCGRGSFANRITCREYVGLEYTEASVSAARANGLTVYCESISEYAQRASAAHDVVCFFQVLEHVPNVSTFLTDSLRCLRPGGILIISVPSADSFLAYSLNNILNMPPHHVTRWSTRALVSLGKYFNLQVVDQQHEQLADEHVQNYVETLILLALSSEYRKLMPLTDLSLVYRIRIRLASKLAKLVVPALSDKSVRPLGHSITFVYRKSV